MQFDAAPTTRAPTAIALVRPDAAFDAGATRWTVGLIALATDSIIERDFAAMSPGPEFGIHVSRVPFANPTTRQNLLAMAPRLGEAARLILPEQQLDVIAYGCTSGTALIGHAEVEATIQAARPGTRVVTPSQSAIGALAAFQASKVALLAPYIESVTRAIVDCLEAAGFALSSAFCLGLEDDRDIARVPPESLIAIAERTCAPEADALFLSCTALRAAGIVETLEIRLGIPVLCSNQVMFWQAMRQAGCSLPVSGFGRLLSIH